MMARSLSAALVLVLAALLATPAVAHASPPTFGALGDSITSGEGTTNPSTDAYPVRAGVPWVGEPGRCVATKCFLWHPLVGHLDEVLPTFGAVPRVIVVHLGVNDLNFGSRPARVTYGLAALREEGRDHGVRIVFGTLLPPALHSPDFTVLKAKRDRVNQWIRAQRTFVDYGAALSNRRGGMPRRFGDGLHPSTLGAQVMAETLQRWMASQSTAPR